MDILFRAVDVETMEGPRHKRHNIERSARA